MLYEPRKVPSTLAFMRALRPSQAKSKHSTSPRSFKGGRSGKYTSKVVPFPRAEVTSIEPPWADTMHFTMNNPNPVPDTWV
jgi:hypothetical protein